MPEAIGQYDPTKDSLSKTTTALSGPVSAMPSVDTTSDTKVSAQPSVTPDVTTSIGKTGTPELAATEATPELSTTVEGGLGDPYKTLAEERAAVGTDFAGYEATAPSGDVTAGKTFSTPETTVQGQLESILAKQGPLQKLAASRAKEQAAAMGMSASSAGMGAMYRAQIDSAMPMAQQDAQTAATFQQAEQQAVNEKRRIDQEAQVSGDLTLQKAKLNEQQKKIDDSFALSMKGLDAETEQSMLDAKANWDMKINEANNAFQEKLKNSELSAQTSQLLMNQAQESMTQVQISMQNLMGDSEFLDDMAAADEALIAQAQAEGKSWSEIQALKGSSVKNYMNRLLGQATNTIAFNAKSADIYTPEFQQDLTDMIEGVMW